MIAFTATPTAPRRRVEETIFIEEFWDTETLGDVLTEVTSLAQQQRHRFGEIAIFGAGGQQFTQAELFLITYQDGTERMMVELS
jgi:hypothetical protein